MYLFWAVLAFFKAGGTGFFFATEPAVALFLVDNNLFVVKTAGEMINSRFSVAADIALDNTVWIWGALAKSGPDPPFGFLGLSLGFGKFYSIKGVVD